LSIFFNHEGFFWDFLEAISLILQAEHAAKYSLKAAPFLALKIHTISVKLMIWFAD